MNKINKRTNTFFLILLLVHIGASIVLSALILGNVNISTFTELIWSELTILIPAFIFLLVNKYDLREWVPFNRIKPLTILLIIVFTFFTMPFISMINVISQLFTTNAVVDSASSMLTMPYPIMVILIGLYGPFCEEFVFRGIIFHGFKWSGKIIGAALLSSLYFGLTHMNLNQCCYALILGFIFCLLVEATGSIWSSIIAHAVINTYNTLLLIATDIFYADSGTEIYEDAQNIVTTDFKLAAIGMLLVISVFTTAVAVFLFIAICKHENRLEHIKALFHKANTTAKNKSEDIDVKDIDAENIDVENNNIESINTEEKTTNNRLLTLSGWISIAICIFGIFFLDKVIELFK